LARDLFPQRILQQGGPARMAHWEGKLGTLKPLRQTEEDEGEAKGCLLPKGGRVGGVLPRCTKGGQSSGGSDSEPSPVTRRKESWLSAGDEGLGSGGLLRETEGEVLTLRLRPRRRRERSSTSLSPMHVSLQPTPEGRSDVRSWRGLDHTWIWQQPEGKVKTKQRGGQKSNRGLFPYSAPDTRGPTN